MSFKMVKPTSFRWPIEYRMPVDGGYAEVDFQAHFKLLPQSRIDKIGAGDYTSDRDVCDEILVGADGLIDETGAPLSFNDAVKSDLLDFPNMPFILVRTFIQAIYKAREKN